MGVFFGRAGGLCANLLIGSLVLGILDVPWRTAVFGLTMGAIFCAALLATWVKFLGPSGPVAESALAVLIEEADWDTLRAHMDAKYTGEVVVSEIVEEHLDTAEESRIRQGAVELPKKNVPEVD